MTIWIALWLSSGYFAGVIGIACASSAEAPWLVDEGGGLPFKVLLYFLTAIGGPASWALTAAMYLAHHKEAR